MDTVLEQRIEKLVRMSQREFLAIQKRFSGVHGALAQLRRDVTNELERFATKTELRLMEERLLDAIRGTEVKKQDFEALQSDVKELDGRVATLEKEPS